MTNRRIVIITVDGALFDAHEDSNHNRKKRRQNLLRFDYYPETDSLCIELSPARSRPEHGHGTQVAVGEGRSESVIDVDADGVPVGIDIHSFASETVDITKLEAEGPVFGLTRAGNCGRRVG